MPLLRVYVAVSLDGFIATPDGGVAWLDPFNAQDYGFPAFMKQIDTVVVGRKTFDQSLAFPEWAYGDAHVIVHTRRALPRKLPRPVEAFAGDVRALARRLRARRKAKDVWLVGGGVSIRAFAAHGLVDRWELFVMPVLLGDGVPLFPPGGGPQDLVLEGTRAFPNGVVALTYRRGRGGPSPRATRRRAARSRRRRS